MPTERNHGPCAKVAARASEKIASEAATTSAPAMVAKCGVAKAMTSGRATAIRRADKSFNLFFLTSVFAQRAVLYSRPLAIPSLRRPTPRFSGGPRSGPSAATGCWAAPDHSRRSGVKVSTELG